MKDKNSARAKLKQINLLCMAIILITITMGYLWIVLSEVNSLFNILILPLIAGMVTTAKSIKIFDETVDGLTIVKLSNTEERAPSRRKKYVLKK